MSRNSRSRPAQAPGPSRLPIDSITVGPRYRRDMGDIPALAANIREIGLLHPIPVKPNGELIAGARRLAACRLIGLTEVPVNVVDLDATVKGEYAENEYRDPFLPSESVAIKRAVEQSEKAAAKKRQGTRTDKHPGKLPTSSKGRAADRVAKKAGMTRRTLEKAEAVVAAAEAEPDKYGKLVEQMDRAGKVDGAHRKLLEMRGEKPKPKRRTTQQYVAHAVHVQRMMDKSEIESVKAENAELRSKLATAERDNVGPASTGELERKDREQLRNDKRMLEIKIGGLESEIAELKTTRQPASASRCEICREKKRATQRSVFVCDRCAEIHELDPSSSSFLGIQVGHVGKS